MRVSQKHRPPAQDVIQKLVPVRVREGCPARRDDVSRRAAHRAEGANGGVDPAGEKTQRALVERFAFPGVGECARLLHGFFVPRSGAIDSAKYVMITSAPARRIDVSDSRAARSPSSHPSCAAAWIIANSSVNDTATTET